MNTPNEKANEPRSKLDEELKELLQSYIGDRITDRTIGYLENNIRQLIEADPSIVGKPVVKVQTKFSTYTFWQKVGYYLKRLFWNNLPDERAILLVNIGYTQNNPTPDLNTSITIKNEN